MAQYCQQMQIKGREFIGVDSNPLNELISKKENNLNLKFIKTKATDLSMIKDNSVDFVWSMATNQYVEDSIKMIEEVYRVLKEEGEAVISLVTGEKEIMNNYSFIKVIEDLKLTDEFSILKQIPSSNFPYKEGRVLKIIKKKNKKNFKFPYKFKEKVYLFPEGKFSPASKYYVTGNYEK